MVIKTALQKLANLSAQANRKLNEKKEIGRKVLKVAVSLDVTEKEKKIMWKISQFCARTASLRNICGEKQPEEEDHGELPAVTVQKEKIRRAGTLI